MAENGYVGNIKNTGAQVVKGPHVDQGGSGKGTVKTGTDLRAGK